jgi:hypothetical protein
MTYAAAQVGVRLVFKLDGLLGRFAVLVNHFIPFYALSMAE